MKFKRFLITILAGFLVYFSSNAYLNRLQDKKNIDDYGTEAAENNKRKKVANEILVLLVGVDASKNKENPEPTRTDTIMLCKINSETGKIDLLSIPRDSRVKVRDEFTKINHAHAYGGMELTLKTLRDFLGVDIDYYAEVNFKAVVDIVDGMGGVNYKVPKGVEIKSGGVHIKSGMNKMNGKEVLTYLRARSIYENADLGRVNAQQEFLKALINELVKKSKTISMTSLVETYFKSVKTNIPLKTMLEIASKISNFSSEKFTTYTVPGVPDMIGGISYYIPDYEKTWEIVNKVFSKYKLKGWKKEDSSYREYENFGYSNDQNLSNDNYQKQIENNQTIQEIPEYDNEIIQETPRENNEKQQETPAENSQEQGGNTGENQTENGTVDDKNYFDGMNNSTGDN